MSVRNVRRMNSQMSTCIRTNPDQPTEPNQPSILCNVFRVYVCVCVACSASMLARISASVCLASDDALIAASDSHGPGMETVCIMRSPGNLGLKASGVGSSSKWSVAASSVVGGEFGVANDCGKMRGGIASAD